MNTSKICRRDKWEILMTDDTRRDPSLAVACVRPLPDVIIPDFEPELYPGGTAPLSG